ncbi:MAG: FeoB-associated Cys-rich membrane protein [Oscillospiraceae bacterium]|nr:FeoB-associated Cys-rich membrane protein [Oscillospiraceae bacterium]
MTDIIIIAAVVAVIGLATLYIIKEKKKGKKCIGCPDGGCCGCALKNKGGNCSGKDNNEG